MTQSKAVKNESAATLRGTIIDNVFELHRKSNHYSIRKRTPSLYENIVKETKNIPLDILEKSYDIYKGAVQENGKVPHPNYFLKVVKSSKPTDSEHKQIWGKTI